MEVSIFKVFFTKRKECAWLNELGKSGHLLLKIKDSKYIFEKNDSTYSYSIENLGFSSQSKDAEAYYALRVHDGIRPIIYDKNWVYFVSENKAIECSEKAILKNASFHFWKMFYCFFFAFCGCVFSGYQVFSIELLKRIGQIGDGRITTLLLMNRSNSIFTALLNALKRIINHLIKAINGYFSIWTEIFGEYEPIAVLSILIPITLLLLIFGAFHFDEYIHYRSYAKSTKEVKSKKECVADNAEQTI